MKEKKLFLLLIKVLREKGIEIYDNYNFAEIKLKREEFTENIKQELQDLVIEAFKFVKYFIILRMIKCGEKKEQ